MKDLKPIKKAIILYAAVTVIEQLLNRHYNSLVIPKTTKNTIDYARRLLKSAEQHCK